MSHFMRWVMVAVVGGAFLFSSEASVQAEEELIALVKKDWPIEELPAFNKVLLAEKRDIDTIVDEKGMTPLHWAAKVGYHTCATLFLLRGADPNKRDQARRTPIFYAAESGHDWLVRSLLLRGAKPELTDLEGWTPLALAVKRGHAPTVELLLWTGAPVEPKGVPIDKQPLTLAAKSKKITALLDTYRGDAPAPTMISTPAKAPAFVEESLQRAATRGDWDAIERLVSSGSDINARDESGKTALSRSILAAQPDVTFYLLMMGADPNIVAARTNTTPLMANMGWFGWGFDRVQEMLLLKGADPLAVTPEGWTQFGFACLKGNTYTMSLLMGLGIDPKAATPKGTPLEIAFYEGNANAITTLRRFGVNDPLPFKTDPFWNFQQAVKLGDVQAVEKALATGVPVDTPDEAGNSPLMTAIGKQQLKVAALLIEKGADINFVNKKTGWTPLFVSIIWDYHEMTLFRDRLLKAKANPNVTNKDGTPLLMRALWHEPTKPLEQLVEYKIDLKVHDGKGRTAIQVATDDGKLKTADYLRSLGAPEK